jgi:hypothetical protein
MNRVAIWGVMLLVLGGILSVVGYVVYGVVKDAAVTATGGTPVGKVSMSRETLRNPLKPAQRCLSRADRRARDSYASYLAWVDPEAGPSCKEKSIGQGLLGLYPDVPGICSDAAGLVGVLQQKSLEEALRGVGSEYTKLLALSTDAGSYYKNQGYKSDGCKQGKNLHAPLTQAFTATLAASDRLRGALLTYATTKNKIIRDKILFSDGTNSAAMRLLDFVLLLDRLTGLFFDGEVNDTEIAEMQTLSSKFLILRIRVGKDLDKADKADAEVSKMFEKSKKLADMLRKAKIRQKSGSTGPMDMRHIERELRTTLRLARSLKQIHSPILLFAE